LPPKFPGGISDRPHPAASEMDPLDFDPMTPDQPGSIEHVQQGSTSAPKAAEKPPETPKPPAKGKK